MPKYLNGVGRGAADSSAIGVLLVNTGTPDGPDAGAVRRFLAEMLSDPRLVELPRAIWLPVLHGIVLRLRPRRSARAYQAIWTEAGSPQLVYAERLRSALAARLGQALPVPVHVGLGMSYGNPSIALALDRLQAAGCRRLLVLPLFPQFTAVATGPVFDRVVGELQRWRCLPELRFIRDYHDDDRYIAALRTSIQSHWAAHGRPEHLLMSFHSMPQACVEKGDPYADQVRRTADRLAGELGLATDQWSLSFQSRFGFQEWLRPYTDDAVAKLGKAGVRRLGVVCPGFAVDCLESLEEVALGLPETFSRHGGGSLDYIPALNDAAGHVDCLAGLVGQHAAGWYEPAETAAQQPVAAVRAPLASVAAAGGAR